MTRTQTPRRAAALAVAMTLLTSVGLVTALAPSAGATTLQYSGSSTGTASTLTLHRGDSYERVLHPTGTITATLDDTNHTVTGGTVAFDPSYTDTFVGPFSLNLYVRTDLEQIGPASGSATDSGTPGVANVSVQSQNRLHLTVFRQKGATQDPATDGKMTDPAKCYVDLSLSLSGTADRRTGDLSVGADPFTIPAFPNGTPDPAKTCQLATSSLNAQVAGPNNAIALHFSGGPTSAHYTGKTTGTQSTIVIKKGNKLLERTVNPTGALVGDIDFTTGTLSNVSTTFSSITMKAFPGILSSLPAYAKIDMSTIGTPAAALTPSGTPGIDTISVQTTARMAVTVSLLSPNGIKLTNPSSCYVDLHLNLSGTVDRGTDKVSLNQNPFTIPSFGRGCGLLMGPALTLLVSGSSNSISLNYSDGVLP